MFEINPKPSHPPHLLLFLHDGIYRNWRVIVDWLISEPLRRMVSGGYLPQWVYGSPFSEPVVGVIYKMS